MRAARSAFESFVHLFKGGGVQGRSPCPRSAERGTPLCSHKRRRGSKGEPSPGVPPFSLLFCVCAVLLGGVVALSCHSTPFLWCLPKETVSSRQRKAPFLPRRLHHSRERYCLGCLYSSSLDLGRGWWLTGRSSQLDAVGGDVGALCSWERRVGPNSSRGGTQKRVSLGLHPVSLRKSKEMGWNGQQGAAAFARGNGAHVQGKKQKKGNPSPGFPFNFIPSGRSRLSPCPCRWIRGRSGRGDTGRRA